MQTHGRDLYILEIDRPSVSVVQEDRKVLGPELEKSLTDLIAFLKRRDYVQARTAVHNCISVSTKLAVFLTAETLPILILLVEALINLEELLTLYDPENWERFGTSLPADDRCTSYQIPERERPGLDGEPSLLTVRRGPLGSR